MLGGVSSSELDVGGVVSVGFVLDGVFVSVRLGAADVVEDGLVVVVWVGLAVVVLVGDVELWGLDCSVLDGVVVGAVVVGGDGVVVVGAGEVVVLPVDAGGGSSVVVPGAGGVPAVV